MLTILNSEKIHIQNRVWYRVDQIRDRALAQVRSHIWNRVWDQVRFQVWYPVKNQLDQDVKC